MKKEITLPKLLLKAQLVFNRFIRLRDQYKGCISCKGRVEQAGHFFSQGHHSALRFNEINCAGQCVRCNCFLHGNLINFRQGLIRRYGAEAVDKLELSAKLNRIKKWSKFELEELIKMYSLIAKE